jgi:RNA polymerase sigma factor (sigma-70 family)
MTDNQSGDFVRFYEDYFAKIFALTFSITRNHEDSRQLTQETFTRVYSYITSSQNQINSKALAYRIACNMCFDYMRKKKKEANLSANQDLSVHSISDPESHFLKKQKERLIHSALSHLPFRDHQCLILYSEGFSYAEIAETVNLNKRSVGKILSRATDRMARFIKQGESK